jgi:hypothetical protein
MDINVSSPDKVGKIHYDLSKIKPLIEKIEEVLSKELYIKDFYRFDIEIKHQLHICDMEYIQKLYRQAGWCEVKLESNISLIGNSIRYHITLKRGTEEPK